MPHDLIPLSEAVALLARPSRGVKVHTSSIHKWGSIYGEQKWKGTFWIYRANGLKVSKREFLNWARRTHRLYTPHVPHFREYRIDRRAHELAMMRLRLCGIAT